MKFFVSLLFLLALALPLSGVFAVGEDDIVARRAQLERDLAALENEIGKQGVFLEEKRGERVSLERDIAILDAQIRKAQLSIRARDLSVQKLTTNIGSKSETITGLDAKLLREQQSLANILRKTNELDARTLAEFIFAAKDVSDFFADIDSFAAIKASLRESFVEIEDTKVTTAGERSELQEQRTEERELRTLQVLEKTKIEKKEEARSEILKVTKGQEDAYQDIINTIERSAAEIRSELFTLRGSAAIPFGDAYDFALQAGTATGVRPALILAILKQESELGENVGSCNRAGDPVEKSWSRIMPGPEHYANYLANGKSCIGAKSPCSWRDDQTIFKDIVGKLGFDYRSMPLSCPLGGNIGGWGGAMGPSQFIPSTWRSYEDRIASIVGASVANPWNPEHAITGTALLMAENGADRGTRSSERLAALRYFAGWVNAERSAYSFYGDGVMEHAAFFQKQIDILSGS